MDDTAITLQDAIKKVDEWLASADKGCRVWGSHSTLDKTEQRYHDMYVTRWAALKDVALLLAKVIEADGEYEKHDTE